MKQQDLLALMACLYDTVLEPDDWRSLASVVARSFDCESAVIQIQDRPRGIVDRLSTTSNYTPEINQAYCKHYYKYDLWVAAMLRKPRLAAVIGPEIVPDDVFFRSTHYHEFCKQLGITCVVGSVFPLAGDAVGIVGIHRTDEMPKFDLSDKRMMDLFLPHLRRALQVRTRLTAARLARRVTAETLGSLDVGVAVVNARCRIIFLNAAAEALLRDGCGATITLGELRLRDPRLRVRLEALVAAAAATGAGKGLGSGGVLALPRPWGQSLSVLVCPLRVGQDGLGPAEPMALIFVTDPHRTTLTAPQVLRQFYGLTGAEARLLAALLAGERLQDYAERNAVTVNTVRNQLAHVFNKTGTSRQAELVQSCLSNPVLRIAAGRVDAVP